MAGASGRRADGTFAPGTSGNPFGRRIRADAKPEARHDGLINVFTGHGTDRDRRTSTYHQTAVVIDENAIDLRRGNWIAARICELLDDDAFRRGYELKLDDKEEAETVMDAVEDLGINKKAEQAGQMERTAGGAALFPVLDGALGDLNEPLVLDPKEPRIGKVLALHLLEPRELRPWTWYTDLEHPKFGQPETYWLRPLLGGMSGAAINALARQVIVHESRLAIYPGLKFTRQPLNGQRLGWGDSALTRPNEAISDFGLSWGSAASILHDFAQGVVKLDQLVEMLREEGGEALVSKRLAVMDMTRSSLRAMVLDKNDEFTRTSTPVSGLSDLLIQFAQLIAAAADMPLTRLFGMSPAGLNATGQSDMQGWYERVGVRQTDHTANLEWMIRLVMLSADGPTQGQEPDEWSIEWRPLQKPSEKETADTRYAVAQADKIYFDMGAASSDDIAKSRFGGDTYSMETVIDWDAREAQQKIDEQKAAEIDKASIAAMGRGVDAIASGAANGKRQPPKPGTPSAKAT